jgi:hypothetical protein
MLGAIAAAVGAIDRDADAADATDIHDLRGRVMTQSRLAALLAAAEKVMELEAGAERAEAERDALAKDAARMREALKFYANCDHLYGSLKDDWDECGDSEYRHWLWPSEPAEEMSWGVEDGETARAALAAQGGSGA